MSEIEKSKLNFDNDEEFEKVINDFYSRAQKVIDEVNSQRAAANLEVANQSEENLTGSEASLTAYLMRQTEINEKECQLNEQIQKLLVEMSKFNVKTYNQFKDELEEVELKLDELALMNEEEDDEALMLEILSIKNTIEIIEMNLKNVEEKVSDNTEVIDIIKKVWLESSSTKTIALIALILSAVAAISSVLSLFL